MYVGFLGSITKSSNRDEISLFLNVTSGTEALPNIIRLSQIVDGFATPVGVANLDSPIRNVEKASLMVHPVSIGLARESTCDQDVLELQLWDGANVVWRQYSNANVMEMQDTGHLNLLHNSTNGSRGMEYASYSRHTCLGVKALLWGRSW